MNDERDIAVRASETSIAIATALIHGDTTSSTRIVDELDPMEVHGVIAALAGAFYGTVTLFAAETDREPHALAMEILRGAGAQIASIE